MKRLMALLALFAMVAATHAVAEPVSTGFTDNPIPVLHDSGAGGCPILCFNADGTYENGYAWQYGGIVPPDYGAFAECCFVTEPVFVCEAIFDFTQVGNQAGQLMDVYIWDDAGGIPGGVRCLVAGVDPGPIAFWPSVSSHQIAVNCNVSNDYWVGYWGNWPGEPAGWFIGADQDGLGGCPLTKIAPGIGFPTGWNHVEVVWGPTQALGLGSSAMIEPTPAQQTTWGKIKSLY